MRADQLQQVGGATDLLIAIGNVEIIRGQTRLLADRVELNRDTGQAVAQGKVVFYDGPDRLVGERIDYNLKTGTGVVYNGSAVSAPYYHLSAERMDRVGDSVYEMRRGVFTTCEGDDPPWSFRFGSGTADLDDIVYGRDASFWVKGIPVLPWVPFFAAALRRERQSGFLFPEFGTVLAQGRLQRRSRTSGRSTTARTSRSAWTPTPGAASGSRATTATCSPASSAASWRPSASTRSF